MTSRYTILLVFLLIGANSFAQNLKKVDSLETVLDQTTSDTAKVKIMNDIFWELFMAQPDKAGSYAEEALRIAIALNYPDYIADSYNSIGVIYALKGNFSRALENYLNCLRIYEQANDTAGIAITYNNIGLTYSNLFQYDIALDYYFKALEIYEAAFDTVKMAKTYNNIGLIHSYTLDTALAFDYYRRSISIKMKIGRLWEAASTYENIGILYADVKVYDKALANYQTSLALNIQSDNRVGIVYSLRGIGEVMLKQNLEGAFVFLDSSLMVAREMGMLREESDILMTLADGYEQYGEYDKALMFYKLYTTTKDSLYNADKSKDIGRLEAKHEFEVAEDKKKNLEAARLAKVREEEQRRNNLQYSGILIFLVLLGGGIMMLGRFAIPVRLAEGLVFFSFLLLFEFCLVLLDPYIEEFSSGAPALNLAFNAVLAAMIFPLHSFFETKLKKRMEKQ